MEYKAKHRYADMSPRKIRPVAALVRGRDADEALELLRFLPSKSARLIEAVLKSALGNAEDRRAANPNRLVVIDARVDQGPMFKRIRPRARGMAFMVKKRTCHIKVAVEAAV